MTQSRSKRKTPYYGKRKNVGAYEQPFSGIGVEFEPLGAAPADIGFVLHEAGYWAKAYAWNFPKVYSPFWRVYYDFDPGHHVRFGDELSPLGPDRVLVIPNHQRFDCEGDAHVAKLWFALSCNRNADPAQSMPIIVPANDTIRALASEFPPLFRKRKADMRHRIYQQSLVFTLYVLNRPQIRWQQPLPQSIGEVIAAINKEPGHPWTNSDLAKRAGMSVDGFIRSFRQWLTTTPIRYVQQVRIREACRLLSESNESIDQIAVQLGFADRFYFSRVFKQHTNTSPSLYRKRRHSCFLRRSEP